MTSRSHILKPAILALAISAVAAPAALAADPVSPDARDATLQALQSQHSTTPVSPDARDATLQALRDQQPATPVRTDLISPDARDAARGVIVSESVPAVRVVSSSSHTFDWGDAAIGGGAILGLTMLGAGGAFLVARRRETQHPHRSGTALS